MTRSALPWLSASILALSGCSKDSSDGATPECLIDLDCSGSQICEDGHCIQPGSDSTAGAGGEGGAEDEGAEPGGPCGACADERCTEELEACADAPCDDYATCVLGCEDDACVVDCSVAHAEAMGEDGMALLECVADRCSTDCASAEPSTCESCLNANCRAEALACAADDACSELIDCPYRCTDDACLIACLEAAGEEAVLLAAAYTTCADERCAVACGGGEGTGGTGGAAGTGGATATGGAGGSGGIGGSAGSGGTETGGTTDTGGAETGGATDTGGTETGGATDTGGAETGGATGGTGGGACLSEGQSYNLSVRPPEEVCCEGLTGVYGGYNVSSDGTCRMRTGSPTYCSPCGNGQCDEREDYCNCAEDCPLGEDIVALNQAISDRAQIACSKIDACSPARIGWWYGSLEDCRNNHERWYQWLAGRPGSGVTVAALDDCSRAESAWTCDEWRTWLPIPECAFRGEYANGESCLDGSQCSSGHCDGIDYDCGVCVPEPGLGELCEPYSDCDAATICSAAGTCFVPGRDGDACDEVDYCDLGYSCVGGECLAQGDSVGDPCQAGTANGYAPCAEDQGLYCDAETEACVEYAVAEAGEPCGALPEGPTFCASMVWCDYADGSTGTCPAPRGVGDECDPEAGLGCISPDICVNGVCTAPPALLLCL